MSALFMMLLVAVYLGSTLLLYNKQDNENPFFIVYFLGVALGASLASPKVPRLLIFLGVVSAIIAILLLKKFKMLLFVFHGLLIWALSTLIVMDVRSRPNIRFNPLYTVQEYRCLGWIWIICYYDTTLCIWWRIVCCLRV